MNSGMFFRNHPVEVHIASPKLGYIYISLVSDDEFQTVYLELYVQDNFDHAFEIVKELLDFYES